MILSSEELRTTAIDTVSEFIRRIATVSEELAQGPYVAAREEFEPMSIRSKGIDSTNAAPRPHNVTMYTLSFQSL